MPTGDDQPKPGFGQSTKGSLFLSGQVLDSQEKVVCNFDGRFHKMATHTRMYGDPYQVLFL
jgi:hypothetical protein